jgi:hypothetical protein
VVEIISLYVKVAMPQTLQQQMNEQTGILKIFLEAWTKQDAHNKAIEAELGYDRLE